MYFMSLPFDHASLVERGDRVRTTRGRATDNRIRRPVNRKLQDS